MLTNKQILDWLKPQFPDVPKWGNSAYNKNDEKVVCIYSRQHGRVQPKSIGMPTSYEIKSITLLIHWGKTVTPCEEKAYEFYNKLNQLEATTKIGDARCWVLANRTPVLTGRDEHGFYEATIDFDIYIRK